MTDAQPPADVLANELPTREAYYERWDMVRSALGHSVDSAVAFVARPSMKCLISNLVLGPNRDYQTLIQLRARAYDATRDANKRRCSYCGTWGNPSAMHERVRIGRPKSTYHHLECACFDAYLRRSKLCRPQRGSDWRRSALGWKEEVAHRQRVNAARRMERPVRGKARTRRRQGSENRGINIIQR